MPAAGPADTGVMSDSFGLSDPLRGGRRPTSATPFVIIAVAIAIAATLAGAALLVMKRGGEVAAEANQSVGAAARLAADREAQSSLRNALTAARVLAVDGGGTYDIVSPAALSTVEPDLSYVSSSANGPRVVSVAVSGTEFGAAALSSSGTCFWIHDGADGTFYGGGDPCTGAAALGASQSSW